MSGLRSIGRAPRALAIVVALVLAGAAFGAWRVATTPRASPSTVSLPKLSNQTASMRVVYLVNERLPRMDAEQLQVLLDSVAATAKAHFHIDIQFEAVREMPLAEAFARIPMRRRSDVQRHVLDFRSGKVDTDRLARDFASEFAKLPEPMDRQVDYARPHAPDLPANSGHKELGRAMAQLQLERLARWQALQAEDGQSVLADADYNEFMLWVALGYGDFPYELVLTNQIIASVENVVPSVHSAIRGGYSNGITTYSRRSRYGAMSVWSTFAFTGNDAALVAWRGGERYAPLEAARLAGIAATHEIGHQIFHLQHPFGRAECLMNPVPMFAYRKWSLQLSAEHCPLGSSREMTPGSTVIQY